MNKTQSGRYDAHMQDSRTLKIICFMSNTIRNLYKRGVEIMKKLMIVMTCIMMMIMMIMKMITRRMILWTVAVIKKEDSDEDN